MSDSADASGPEGPAGKDRPATRELPRTTGGFRLERELGRGGMGIVYEAEELASGRRVAVKVLSRDLEVSDEALQRFRREARLAAAISDPHCIFIYGAHEVDGAPAIAMELCPGDTLEDRIAGGEPIPVEQAVAWMIDVLDGLDAAHGAGVLHRDVKPSNCFFDPNGRVKIGDFGLSRTLERDVRLTQSGTFLGSPLYASPEQVRGRDVDVRSDVYSAAATLYALLTRRPPFKGPGIGEILAQIVSETPESPRALRPDVPRGLERIVLRAMQRDPAARFPDHASFRNALARYAGSPAAPGGIGRRFLGYVLDTVIIGGVNTVLATGLSSTDLEFAQYDPDRPFLFRSLAYQTLLQSLGPLYFGLTEGRFGATVGKWALGLRVVATSDGEPSMPRALLRAFVFTAPAMVGMIALSLKSGSGPLQFIPFTCLPVIVTLLFLATMRKRNGYAAVWGLASGTRVVSVPSPFDKKRRELTTDVEIVASPDLPEEVGPYPVEGLVGTTPHGRLLAGRDPGLERPVWIFESLRDRERRVALRRRDRAGRLRWLERLETDSATYEVFEAPGGTSWLEQRHRTGPLDWPSASGALFGLAAELDASGSDARFSVAQLWIDRFGAPRVIDDPVVPASALAAPASDEDLDRLALLAAGARVLLFDDERRALGADVPERAETVVGRLTGRAAPFESFAAAHAEVQALRGRPTRVTAAARTVQLAASVLVPLVLFVFQMGMAGLSVHNHFAQQDATRYLRELDLGREVRSVVIAGEEPQALDEDGRRARELLVAEFFQSASGPLTEMMLPETGKERVRRMVAEHGNPTVSEIEWARSEIGVRDVFGEVVPYAAMLYALPMMALGWGFWATLFALVFRGGATLSAFGIRIRTRGGERASRLRCVARVLVGWVPMLALGALVCGLGVEGLWVPAIGVAAAGVLLLAGGLVHALLRPSESLVDRLAGTRLVPR